MAGRPEDASDKEILRAVLDTASPVASTSEIRDEIPIKHKATLDRLKDLDNRGLVEGKKLPNGWVWSLTEDGEAYLAGDLDASEMEGEDG